LNQFASSDITCNDRTSSVSKIAVKTGSLINAEFRNALPCIWTVTLKTVVGKNGANVTAKINRLFSATGYGVKRE
jgi:hypothetical protein